MYWHVVSQYLQCIFVFSLHVWDAVEKYWLRAPTHTPTMNSAGFPLAGVETTCWVIRLHSPLWVSLTSTALFLKFSVLWTRVWNVLCNVFQRETNSAPVSFSGPERNQEKKINSDFQMENRLFRGICVMTTDSDPGRCRFLSNLLRVRVLLFNCKNVALVF